MKPGVVFAVALGLLASAHVQTLRAADAPAAQAADSLDEIIVTGTRTKGRTVLDSPVPVEQGSGDWADDEARNDARKGHEPGKRRVVETLQGKENHDQADH